MSMAVIASGGGGGGYVTADNGHLFDGQLVGLCYQRKGGGAY